MLNLIWGHEYATPTTMLKKILIASFIIWIICASRTLLITYKRIYLSHKEAEVQLNKELAEQERISKLPIPALIEHVAPKNADKLKKLAFCESGYKNSAVHYNDGQVGSHSYGLYQYKIPTWERYEKQYGQDLNMDSPMDSIKLTEFVLEKHGGYDWYNCSKKNGII